MSNPPLPHKQARRYHSYLVRLWHDDQQTTWRALAQSVQTGEIVHFVDLTSLFAFLQAQTDGQTEVSQAIDS
ncbi:MAG: hypothetical protein DYG89_52450 [Caldilinea sp. CFX5]|nr:hypothetical protein [Caldilinea sp. CFX5]